MKNSISQCSKCELISTPRRWSCVKCGMVPQIEVADLHGEIVTTTTVFKSPDSGLESLNEVSLSFSKSGVYFLS